MRINARRTLPAVLYVDSTYGSSIGRLIWATMRMGFATIVPTSGRALLVPPYLNSSSWVPVRRKTAKPFSVFQIANQSPVLAT